MELNSPEEIYINLIHYPVYTLGIGKRIGIWFQGCSIRCKGCIAPYTWDFKQIYKRTVNEILEEIIQFNNSIPDGITISGGEPFDQPDALYMLLRKLRESGFKDITAYSGYNFEHLKEKYSHILELMDALIDGPFVQGLKTDYSWKGSDNQQMIILTDNKELKEAYLEHMKRKCNKRELQIIECGNKVFIIGIPKQQDMEVIKNGIS